MGTPRAAVLELVRLRDDLLANSSSGNIESPSGLPLLSSRGEESDVRMERAT